MQCFGVGEFRALDGIDDAAVRDNRNPVAQAQEFIEVRGHDEHAGARLRRVVHHAVDFLARADIDADGRFIEHEQLGARMIPLREDHFLLIAAG